MREISDDPEAEKIMEKSPDNIISTNYPKDKLEREGLDTTLHIWYTPSGDTLVEGKGGAQNSGSFRYKGKLTSEQVLADYKAESGGEGH